MLAKSSATTKVEGHYRRGTYNGHLAYIHVNGHSRTAHPKSPTKRKDSLVDPKKHSVVEHCALPNPKSALKMAQGQSKPKAVLTKKPRIETVD